MRIKVANIKTTTVKPSQNRLYIYAGRGRAPKGSINLGLGNPYTVKEYGRGVALGKYNERFPLTNEYQTRLTMLKDIISSYGAKEVILLCWCHPEPCHAQTIKEYLDKELNISDKELPTLHSGGTYGADTYFKEQADRIGMGQYHYYLGQKSEFNAPNGNTHISEQDVLEGAKKCAIASKLIYENNFTQMQDLRLIRNWCQVKYADVIIAVSNCAWKGERVGKRWDDHRVYVRDFVAGGTAYAVAMGIMEGKPIFFFAQNVEEPSWFTWDYGTKYWKPSEAPDLRNYQNFAGIGSSDLNHFGKQAIEDLFKVFN